jgi:predicted aspartyl protease
MQVYDVALFSPPAPLARVTLRDPESGAAVTDVPMLVDTGADVTLIPRSSVHQLGVVVDTDAYELMGFDGSKSLSYSVRLNLELLGKTFKGKFLLVDQEWGLVGRDVLNHLFLLFDGPRLSWGEQRSSGV